MARTDASVVSEPRRARIGSVLDGPDRVISERTVAPRNGYLQAPYGRVFYFGGPGPETRPRELTWALCVLNTFTPGFFCALKAQGTPKSTVPGPIYLGLLSTEL